MMQFKSNKKKVLSQIKQSKENALEQVGKFVKDKAAAKAPVDTGALKDSYLYEKGEDEVAIGSKIEYAGYVELGTSRQYAQPHLTPAFEENITEISLLVKEAMKIDE